MHKLQGPRRLVYTTATSARNGQLIFAALRVAAAVRATQSSRRWLHPYVILATIHKMKACFARGVGVMTFVLDSMQGLSPRRFCISRRLSMASTPQNQPS